MSNISISKEYRPCVRRLLCCLVAVALILLAPLTQAQNDPESINYRILILHGVWKNDFWEHEFDHLFSTHLNAMDDLEIHVSSQYLGLNRALPPGARERLLENINAIITEQEVDLLVAVQPDAINFLLELPVVNSLPSLLVLPDESSLPEPALPRQSIILSASTEAMGGTLEEIFMLMPDIREVRVVSGNSEGDLVYLNRFRDLAEQYTDRAEFSYVVGEDRDLMATEASRLPPDTVILTLPYNAFGPDQRPVPSESLSGLAAQSSVPVFGIYDTQLDYGITGGRMTSVGEYATQAAEASKKILLGQSASIANGKTASFYNWPALNRFALDTERLPYDVSIANQPTSLFDDYPFLSALGINLILLLIVCLAFMSWMYRRSLAATVRIRQSEKMARESEQRYRLLADNAADAIWVIQEGIPYLKYCSPASEQITGYSPEESMQTHFRELVSKQDFDKLNQAMLNGGPDPIIEELRLRHKKDGWVWCEIVVQPSKLQTHGKREWVGITRDISKRREAEQQRKQLEDQVRQSQKFESLGTLAGGIAHDFNNILTVIIGIADMLRLEFTDHPDSQRLLNRLLSASDKARGLVQQILTFSRQSKGDRTVVCVSELIEESMQLLQSGKPESVSITTHFQQRDINVLADANQLEQVLLNLVTNSLEAVSERDGIISVEHCLRTFDSDYAATHGKLNPGTYACITITDNGNGMTEEQQRQGFDPFYTSKELGNGMGLAIVHGIVMSHEGAIDLHSAPGRGTTVDLYLPQTTEKAPDSHFPAASCENTDNQLQVLAIDDKPEVLTVLDAMLKKLGHRSISFCNPGEAMELISSGSREIDLVITDYSMPGFTGQDVLNFCNTHCPGIPVIISTGFGEKVTRSDSWDFQPASVLHKPYDLNKLREVISLVTSSL
ncbi:MAG: ATP-binding protein [Pseudomonadales bacterium]|nr:ATP-binding protein [Pseudomonadales bacterium]